MICLTHDNRLKWAAIAALIVALSLPLFSVVAPYVTFRLFVRQLPVGMSNDHVQEALASVRQSSLVSICLLPVVAHLPFVCLPPADLSDLDDISALQASIVVQRTFCEQLVRLAPSPHMFASVTSIENAAELALAFDSSVMLLEDGEAEVIGIGDVSLLIAITEASRSVSQAAYDLLAHVELGVSR